MTSAATRSWHTDKMVKRLLTRLASHDPFTIFCKDAIEVKAALINLFSSQQKWGDRQAMLEVPLGRSHPV